MGGEPLVLFAYVHSVRKQGKLLGKAVLIDVRVVQEISHPLLPLLENGLDPLGMIPENGTGKVRYSLQGYTEGPGKTFPLLSS